MLYLVCVVFDLFLVNVILLLIYRNLISIFPQRKFNEGCEANPLTFNVKDFEVQNCVFKETSAENR